METYLHILRIFILVGSGAFVLFCLRGREGEKAYIYTQLEVGIGESLVHKGRDGRFYFFVLKY